MSVLPELASFSGGPITCQSLLNAVAQSGQAQEVQQRYESSLQETRVAHFTQAAAMGIAPVAASYLLGLAVAWVIRGFRRAGR